MIAPEICFKSATELGVLIRSKEVSPVEVTRAYLDRIEQMDEGLNSFIFVAGDEALRQARAVEQEIMDGQSRSPLHGVPIGIKDQCDVEGWPTTGGSLVLKHNVAKTDSTVVANLRRAGAVLLGKLNMSEFAIAQTTDYPYGRMNNPWDLARSPGESSGGPAAATAGFLCAASLGGDTGGSIRVPASYCGIAGLRPTWGIVSRHGVLPVCWSMDAVGPMTRTVKDSAIVLSAIAGYDPCDTHMRKTPALDYAASLEGDIRGLRVGLIEELTDKNLVDKEVMEAVTAAATKLEGLGATIEEVSLPQLVHAGPAHWVICYAEFAATWRSMIRTQAASLTHMVRVAALAGSLLPAQHYYKALRLREVIRREILKAFERFDVLISPTAQTAAPEWPVNHLDNSQESVSYRLGRPASFTAAFSHAGVPALSVPCGFSSANLPIGLQIAGKPFDDVTVLKLGHAYEQATAWTERRPSLN